MNSGRGLLALLLVGCGAAAQGQPGPAAAFEAGPPITPAPALLAWLRDDANAPPRRLKLPVVVRFTDEHRLGLSGGLIATDAGHLPKDAIALTLDDGGLSISLLDRVRALCPPDAAACALWLEGQWGELVPRPKLPGFNTKGAWPYAVMKVGARVAATDPARAFARPR